MGNMYNTLERGVWAKDFNRICSLKSAVLRFRRISCHWVLIVHKKIIFARSFRISPRKTAFFAVKADFDFIFSQKKIYMQKKTAVFAAKSDI
jgi:hypothetical protein